MNNVTSIYSNRLSEPLEADERDFIAELDSYAQTVAEAAVEALAHSAHGIPVVSYEGLRTNVPHDYEELRFGFRAMSELAQNVVADAASEVEFPYGCYALTRILTDPAEGFVIVSFSHDE